MLTIGCHLSSAKGWCAMGRQAVEIGANTFQFFSRNPRGGAVKALDQADVAQYIEYAAQQGLRTPLAHAPYTVNPCSPKEHLRSFAVRVLAEDIERLERIPGCMYNLHPGSHVRQGAEEGIRLTAEALNAVLVPEQKTVVLLETMAGKGTEIGRDFHEIQAIIERIEHADRVGVCLDTCHVHDAGYDIIGRLDEVLGEFDRIVGLSRLHAIHLNDSKNERGARKDRHERIGEGELGEEALARVINHPALRHLPFYLETPNELDGYAREIARLKSLYQPN